MIKKNYISELCKLNVAVFLFYVFWYKYAFRETVAVIYVTGLIAIVCMVVDLLYYNLDIFTVFPFGVSVNLVMCAFSIITGLFVTAQYTFLVSQIKTYACYTLMCMAICYVTYNEKSSEWLARLLIYVSIVCCLQVAFKGYHKIFYGYVISEDNNPNSFGLVLDLGIFGIIYIFSKIKRYSIKILCYFLIAFFLTFIVGCGSRKCLIAAVIIVLMWIFPLVKERISKASIINKALILFAVAILMVFVVYYYKNYYVTTDSYNRMKLLGDTTNEEGSSAKRAHFYKLALECFVRSPFFGIGFQQFRTTNPWGSFSHSTYAEALASWGMVGCIIYFAPVLSMGRKLMHLAIRKNSSYISKMLLALWVMEIFLGIGQIWFYSIEHMIAWTLVFLCSETVVNQNVHIKKCKYIISNHTFSPDPIHEKKILEKGCKYVKT